MTVSLLTTPLLAALLLWPLLGFAQTAATKPRKNVVAQAAPAKPEARLGDALLGREKGEAERCFECHGLDGEGVAQGPESIFAKLAGQSPAYISAQVQHFKRSLRKNDSMLITARNVSEEDLRDIAAYFAALPPMKASERGANELGARLISQGDAARGIPACASCHGEQGRGLPGSNAPRLAGQALRYLEKQLLDFRHGLRREDAAGALMGPIARSLSEAEITALALQLSAYSAASASSTPAPQP